VVMAFGEAYADIERCSPLLGLIVDVCQVSELRHDVALRDRADLAAVNSPV